MKTFISTSLTQPKKLIVGKNYVDENTDIKLVTSKPRRGETETETFYRYKTTRYRVTEYLVKMHWDIARLQEQVVAQGGDSDEVL